MALPHGSTPLRGDGLSLNTVNQAVPTAVSQDSAAVIFKVPEPIGTPGDHFHFIVETLCDAVRF
jgi:hypothetical protein